MVEVYHLQKSISMRMKQVKTGFSHIADSRSCQKKQGVADALKQMRRSGGKVRNSKKV